MKKLLYIYMFILMVLPISVNASGETLIKVGNNYYGDLQEAIDNASSKDTISLITDISLSDTININKTVNINLNGNTISAKEKVFLIEGGSLHLSGNGTVKETNPNYGAIMIKGSTDPNDIDYSTLKVDKNVTLEGWSGIFINHTNSKSYGTLINFSGKINAVDDIKGDSGIGIYINGSIQDDNNSPIININSDSIINSTGVGLYLAGSSNTNIDNSKITGQDSGISIKSGTLNIKSGTITCNGIDRTPTQGNNNGVNPSGATIQIESNDQYAGNIKLNISGGTLISKHSHVIYEYIVSDNKSNITQLNLSGGTYKSPANKDIFSLSNSFLTKQPKFIKGGKYTSNPEEYLIEGYTSNLLDDLYVVTTSAIKEEFNMMKEQNNNTIKTILSILVIIITIVIVYLNKTKILKIIKLNRHNWL